MHLVGNGTAKIITSSYPKNQQFTRFDSLPYIFKKLRQNWYMTKATLAAKYGASEKYVDDIENGSRFPSLRFCLFCAKEFNANPGWVKNKWVKEAVERYSDRLNKRMGF